MKNMNDQIKMKVLQDLRRHVDGRIGERLRGKKIAPMTPPSAPDLAPKEEMPTPGAAMPNPQAAMPNPGTGDLGDDDKKRLLDLYSSIK